MRPVVKFLLLMEGSMLGMRQAPGHRGEAGGEAGEQ